MKPQEIGQLGEKIAKFYLKKKGYQILAQNFKNKWGEIDLIASKKDLITFFEIKTILTKEGFFAEDKISTTKKKQLLKLAQIYLAQKKIPPNTPFQIDILAVEIDPLFQKAKIKHFENAIEDLYFSLDP